jgi:hypothetical protein
MHPNIRTALPDGTRVRFTGNCSERTDDTNLSARCNVAGDRRARLDHADDGDVEMGFEVINGYGGYRVACHDYYFHPLLQEKTRILERIFPDYLSRFTAIRHARCVTEICDVLIWQMLHECMDHRQSSDSRVEDADTFLLLRDAPG